MRKNAGVLILMLITVLVMFGCSGIGGGTAASSDGGNSTSTPGGGPQSGPVNGFTVNLVDSHVLSAITPANPTMVRVIVTQWVDILTPQSCEDDNGNLLDPCPGPIPISTLVWKDIVDQAYASSITIGVPEGDNYALDVITYNVATTTTTTNSIVSYGSATGVHVHAEGSASVPMSTASDILKMAVSPTPVISKGKFDVTLNNALPFAPLYKMTMSVSGFADSSVTTSATKCTFTAPETFNGSLSVRLVGKFTINTSFLKEKESQAQWTYGEEVDSSLSPLIPVTIPGL